MHNLGNGKTPITEGTIEGMQIIWFRRFCVVSILRVYPFLLTGCESPGKPDPSAVETNPPAQADPTPQATSANQPTPSSPAGTDQESPTVPSKPSLDAGGLAPKLVFSIKEISGFLRQVIPSVTPVHSGGPVTACRSIPVLPSGLSLSQECLITGTPTTASPSTTYRVIASNSFGSFDAIISIQVTAPPSITYSSSSLTTYRGVALNQTIPQNSGGGISGCTSSPSLPAGLSLSSTCAISGTPSAVSPLVNYTIKASNPAGSSSTNFALEVVGPPGILYSPASVIMAVGTVMTPLVPANSGGAIVSCSASNLPAGITINTKCVMSGTPAGTSKTIITVTAANPAGTSVTPFSFNIVSPPSISFTSPWNFYLNSAVGAFTPFNSGGEITDCTSTPPLPPGIALSSSCAISGTPSATAAASNYLITATNLAGSGTFSWNIQVAGPPTIAYPAQSSSFILGVGGTQIVPSVSSGMILGCSCTPRLPNGLSISPKCVISGTATQVTPLQGYTITATNPAGSSTTTLNLEVFGPPVISYSTPPFSFPGINLVGGRAVATLTPANSGSPITGCSAAPSLPDGLLLSTSCVITGTPSSVDNSGKYNVTSRTITASNAYGTGTAQLYLLQLGLAQSTTTGASYFPVRNHPVLGSAWMDPRGLFWAENPALDQSGAATKFLNRRLAIGYCQSLANSKCYLPTADQLKQLATDMGRIYQGRHWYWYPRFLTHLNDYIPVPGTTYSSKGWVWTWSQSVDQSGYPYQLYPSDGSVWEQIEPEPGTSRCLCEPLI